MGRFFVMQSAPQSLEGLDAWGALDSLPWSLDDALWQSAGVWGLEAQTKAAPSGRCSSAVERSLGVQGRAVSRGRAEMICGLVKTLGGEARARSSSSLAVEFSGWGWSRSRGGEALSWHQDAGGTAQLWQGKEMTPEDSGGMEIWSEA